MPTFSRGSHHEDRNMSTLAPLAFMDFFGPVQWISLVVLAGLIAAWVVIRKKQQ